MDAIEIMVEEHKNIKKALEVIRKMCLAILNNKEMNYDDFNMAISFVRNYADKHHHNKEEAILFKKMVDDIGEKAVNAPLSGMYIEHDLGRLFIRRLEEAVAKVKEGYMDSRVDVIANGIAYTDLLNGHIDKEDNAIYKFARRSLSQSALSDLEEKCMEVERNADEERIQEKYLNVLRDLSQKWM